MSDTGSGAGWKPDPYKRKEQRYWDGTTWTSRVWHAGTMGVDDVTGLPQASTAPTGSPTPPATSKPRLTVSFDEPAATSAPVPDRFPVTAPLPVVANPALPPAYVAAAAPTPPPPPPPMAHAAAPVAHYHQHIYQAPQKSVGVAFLLTFFFGPLGMFYSTVTGGAVMLIVSVILSVLTLGLSLVITWPICMIWACVAASNSR